MLQVSLRDNRRRGLYLLDVNHDVLSNNRKIFEMY